MKEIFGVHIYNYANATALGTLKHYVPSKSGDISHIVTIPDLPYCPKENSRIINGSPAMTANSMYGIRNAPAT